jgi:lantibiotic leader peptide-processing serine protease
MRALVNSSITRAVLGLALVASTIGVVTTAPPQLGPARTYVVVYGGQSEAPRTQRTIELAGGAVVAVYGKLGLAFARSGDASFGSRVRQLPGVIGVAPTDRHVWHLPAGAGVQDDNDPVEDAPGQQENLVGSLTARQWDMKQIHAPEAHLVNPGSSNIVVGVIDTGIDYKHPNLAPNIDFVNSASCIGGTANTSPSAWDDDRGHGTHVAGTIAATSSVGVGIDGVAPGVRIASIKTGDSNGDFFLEAVVCAFTWAGDHHINVTNNSYFSDPWLYHCLSDPEQKAIWVAEKRALDYAASKGVVNVAAAGNFNDNLANPTIDPFSPDAGPLPPVFRYVDGTCYTFPSMAPGVITVSSVGQTKQKSYYSSYGTGIVKVTAPGGDFRVTSPEYPVGTVLSTYPSRFVTRPGVIVACDANGNTCAAYRNLQGTSMASPHVAGVVALILSQNGGLSQSEVLARLTSTADPLTCPPDPYYPTVLSPNFPPPPASAPIPPSVQRYPAHCEGSTSYNSFYGYGLVNALRVVS